jgi:hypothetical protein
MSVLVSWRLLRWLKTTWAIRVQVEQRSAARYEVGHYTARYAA